MRKSAMLAAVSALAAVLVLSGCGGKDAPKTPAVDAQAETAPDTAAVDTAVTAAQDTTVTDTAAILIDSITDSRDGKVYKTVKIGSQVWFAQNLDYEAEGSRCFGEGGDVYYEQDGKRIAKRLSPDEVKTNCATYGRLFDWNTAMKACPAGTHLPSEDEWTTLVNYAGGYDVAGKKLKSTSGWNDDDGSSGNGTDEYGFAALPGAAGNDDGSFYGAGNSGFWWGASESYHEFSYGFVYYQCMDCYNKDIYYNYIPKINIFSVRCVQDNGGQK